MERAGGPNISCIQCVLQPLARHSCHPLFLIPLEPISLSSVLAIALFQEVPAQLDRTRSTVPERWPSSQHFRLSISSQHLPRRCSCLAFSAFPSPSSAPPLSFSSPFSVPFPFPLSFSLSLVVDWVSECLWQLCVVCNRAERLVWIQRWENLFMWEMHSWRQVSRRCGLSLAVILHSRPDRRSEMAKYARRFPQIPKLHPAIQPMCVCVYSDLTEWFCVWLCVTVCVCACVFVCMCLQDSILDLIPLPQAWSRVHYRWAIEGRKSTNYSLFIPSLWALSLSLIC